MRHFVFVKSEPIPLNLPSRQRGTTPPFLLPRLAFTPPVFVRCRLTSRSSHTFWHQSRTKRLLQLLPVVPITATTPHFLHFSLDTHHSPPTIRKGQPDTIKRHP